MAITAGSNHSLALKTGGTVVGWGQNNWGQANGAAAGGGNVAIAAGEGHSLVLKNNGTVVGWGYNGYGQANGAAAGGGNVAIAAGPDHSLALKNDGTVVGWGENIYGQANGAAAGSNIVAISTKFSHSLALRNDGTVVAWGANNVGQLAVPGGLVAPTLANWTNAAGGNFLGGHNWQYKTPSTAVSDAQFGINATYAVDFNTNARARTLDVTAGNVSFNLNGFTYEAGQTATIDSPATLTINNGVLRVGGLAGAGGVAMNGGGDLVVGGNDASTTFAGSMSGSGTLTKVGDGTLTLSGNSGSFAGGILLESGVLQAEHDLALGSSGGGIAFSPGAALHLRGGISVNKSLSLNGSGVGGTGALRSLSGDNFLTHAATQRLNSPTAIGVDTGSTLTIMNAIDEGGGSQSLTKVGGGTLILNGINTFTGQTIVNQGTLRVTGSIASSAVTVDTQAAFGARFEQQVALTGSYAGITTISNTANATEARLLAGQNSTGGRENVSMRWRTPGAGPFASDILELSGMTGGFAESDRTDPFVLQMKYNPTLLLGDEASLAASGELYVSWFDPAFSVWSNAVDGNYGGSGLFVLGDWSDFGEAGLADDLGRWGVNSGTNTVWAVLNHNSEFSVNGVNAVPEPGAILLLGLAGCAGFALRTLRKRRPK